MEHDNRVVVEQIFKELFGRNIKLLARTKDIKIDSIVNSDEDMSDQDALDIIGGELVED